ncbi:hypothetical protein D047_1571B, partial [Vibrio parahaemolyticus VPTS-2010_2]
CQ